MLKQLPDIKMPVKAFDVISKKTIKYFIWHNLILKDQKFYLIYSKGLLCFYILLKPMKGCYVCLVKTFVSCETHACGNYCHTLSF